MTAGIRRRARSIRLVLAMAAGLFAARAALAAQQPEEVHFRRGTASAVLQGKLTGWDMKEYALRAGKEQTARVEVISRRINWLIVRFYPADRPDGDNDLMNSDNTNSFSWEGKLPESGEYVLRLFIRRAEARRGGSVDYRARMTILPRGHTALSPQPQ